jgi:hypothetical protein
MEPYTSRRDRALTLVQQIEDVLRREQESNWINGIRLVREDLEREVKNEDDARGVLRDAFRTYQSMTGGYGSFSDYYIHRAEQEELQRVNRAFDLVRAELWTVLQSAV